MKIHTPRSEDLNIVKIVSHFDKASCQAGDENIAEYVL